MIEKWFEEDVNLVLSSPDRVAAMDVPCTGNS